MDKQGKVKKIKLPRKRKKLWKKEHPELDYWVELLILDIMRDEEHHIKNFRTMFYRDVEYTNPNNPIRIKSVKRYY